MEKGAKGREPFLRLVNEKLLYLSSAAAKVLGDRAELYECGGVMALLGSPDGTYHLGAKSERCRGKNLCSAELVSYLREKYGCVQGARLAAWGGAADEPVLFFGRPEGDAPRTLNGNFHPLELSYRRRAGDWAFVEDNCLSFTAELRPVLARRLALYEKGGVPALLADRNGPYRLEVRSGRKGEAVYDRQLAEYLKKRFGVQGRSILLCAGAVEGGVCFAAGEEDLPAWRREAAPRRLDLGAPRNCYLRLTGKGGFYLSAKAAERLGERFSVYAAAGLLAFRPEDGGALAVCRSGYQNLIQAAPLRRAAVERYPGVDRFYLTACGDLLVLSQDPAGPEKLPPRRRFRPLDLGAPPARTAPRERRKELPPSSGAFDEKRF